MCSKDTKFAEISYSFKKTLHIKEHIMENIYVIFIKSSFNDVYKESILSLMKYVQKNISVLVIQDT